MGKGTRPILGLCGLFLFVCIVTVPMIDVAGAPPPQPPLPSGQLPLLIICAGQGPGGDIVDVLCKHSKIEARYLPMAKSEHVKGYKTMIVAIGTSLKGLGAAGISIEEELDRVEEVMNEARKQKLLIIGVHIEGEARRGGHCEKAIDLVAPRVDYLIVRSDGNADGRFTKISTEKKIPMTIIEKTVEFNDLIKKIFGKTS